jgi:deazaflavin-dependent oxidoreductase (nitroreductase family)
LANQDSNPTLGEPKFLYLTTTGRVTSKLHEIEVWFVTRLPRYFVMAEGFGRANWVRNIEHSSRVRVRIGDRNFEGHGRVLDRKRDMQLWDEVAQLMRAKYGWSAGLPIEISPVT